jgi:hypothetical protein
MGVSKWAVMLILNTSNKRNKHAWVCPTCCDVDPEHK